MNEKAMTVFEQYPMEAKKIFKLRGNYGCMTENDKWLLQEYDYSEEKMETLYRVQEYLEGCGILTEKLVRNEDGRFVSVGEDGFGYILKKFFDVEECNMKNPQQLLEMVKLLGKFHNACRSMKNVLGDDVRIYREKNRLESFQKHNRELINIRNYINKRKNKNFFEQYLQKIIQPNYLQASQSIEALKKSAYETVYREACERKQVCHGNFNHHTAAFYQGKVILVQMTRVGYGPAIHDLYDFLRKVLEKNDWNRELGHQLLHCYEEIGEYNSREKEIMKAMLSYPEKFWKIVNYYYNSNKSWYSEKNEEKLRAFQNQEEKRWNFINSL
ncbi:MAG: hypothetical protein K6G85_02750 [Eubacterium sp.]|nr:hypothetical protein [Eubacterium sp.]